MPNNPGPFFRRLSDASTPEQEDILKTFTELLRGPTRDGGRKRAAGSKKVWTEDQSHMGAMYRHLERWEAGETIDPDSGSHPLTHVAWRALALAWQESQGIEPYNMELDNG